MNDAQTSQETQAPLILLVDDEPKNLQVLGSLLRQNGYDITFASNGEQALTSVAQNPPDLIVLDVMMPGMDGYEVCERLKSNLKSSHIPVLFLTARTDTEDIVRGFKAGAVDYVSKPFRAEELLARVSTHVQLKQLKALLPICMYCNKIREENDSWDRLESYIHRHTGTAFSHGICPDCMSRVSDEIKNLIKG